VNWPHEINGDVVLPLLGFSEHKAPSWDEAKTDAIPVSAALLTDEKNCRKRV
jgi:hypothetical protein